MPFFLSPAKVNVFFQTLRRRNDGYTEIVSIMHAINLFDHLQIRLSDRDEFTVTDPTLVNNRTNLVLKAVKLFKQKTKRSFSCRIHLDKKIPQGAGLGGGSSNAATTLFALNDLLQTQIPIETLQEWSFKLGSDVPFFFSEGIALCRGRGEIVQSIQMRPLKAHLAIPNLSVSTKSVYTALDFSTLQTKDTNQVLEEVQAGTCKLFNDLEKPAFSVCQSLSVLKRSLKECGFDEVVMSGSGSSFVCYGNKPSKLPENISFYPIQSYTRKNTNWYGQEESSHETKSTLK